MKIGTRRVISWIALLLFAGSACVRAQLFSDTADGPRYSGRLLSLYAGGGVSWYGGEFTGDAALRHVTLGGAYSVFPELSLAVNADLGRVTYTRAHAGDDLDLYTYQFGTDTQAGRGTNYYAFDLSLVANLMPRDFVTVLVSAGVGVLVFRADDFVSRDATVLPKADFPTGVTLPVGVGLEYFLLRDLSAMLQFRHTFLFTGDFDAYDPPRVAEAWRVDNGGSIAVPDRAGFDALSSASLTVRVYAFESDDYDGDLLPNAEEEAIGTSPYMVDTDVDGLSDYEEVRVHTTNPLKEDTDDDGLGDYFEITRYGTDPLDPDTDTDRLTDSEEVFIYQTDPTDPDTDDDLLSDYEEVIYFQTNPRNPDTDYDGLDDYVEVKVYGTDPLANDTDDDGIYDFNEVVTYKTNPTMADTDTDRLLDYDEISTYSTNPRNPDTDEDGISDADELFVTRTNPLVHNALGGAERHRAAAGDTTETAVQLLETRSLPGGGTSYLLAPRGAPAQREPAAGEVRSDSNGFVPRSVRPLMPSQAGRSLRLDTLTLREGDMLSFCNITFEFDRDEIRPEYLPLLREALAVFRRYPEMRVEIRGHTDAEGGEEYNQALSERRARTVRRFMTDRGVEATRLETRGFGEREPLEAGESDEARARNRRVEFYILSLGGHR